MLAAIPAGARKMVDGGFFDVAQLVTGPAQPDRDVGVVERYSKRSSNPLTDSRADLR